MTTRAILLGDPAYPPLLAAIPDPPLVLYVRGDAEALLAPQVALIGTRKATTHGRQNARRLGAMLVKNLVCVTSGLADGIDGAAHEGALDFSGRTVAVMAHGLHMVYPAQHRRLAWQIVERRGALVSEHPDGTPPNTGAFPRRNRIQSGLSVAVVLVESGAAGGSFHTLAAAKKQGRPIFAVASALSPDGADGARRAASEFGATLVRSAGELREALAPLLREGGR